MNKTDAPSELLFRDGGPENGLAIEKDVAGAAPAIAAMLDQALGSAKQRALADARRTKQSDYTRSSQLQVDAIEDPSLAHGKGEVSVAKSNHWAWRSSRVSRAMPD